MKNDCTNNAIINLVLKTLYSYKHMYYATPQCFNIIAECSSQFAVAG